MFQDLAQLRVLDLSFNMLTSLHPLIHLSLHSIGADVRLDGNRWHCDCRMRSLRRRMAYDSSIGLQNWSMMCASPPILSGKNLLQLEEDDLNCVGTENRPELHQDVTVYSGSEILLSCATQDSIWLTPSGQASVSQPHHLVINDITEKNTGLYVCVSDEVVSVFNLQISKMGGARRKTRSLSRTSRQIIEQGTGNRISQERNLRATQSNLALAVCLSVFITFLIAFILGVLSRPCIDMLWSRVTKKKTSSATNSVSSVEQRQYDNEAYSNGEEQEQMQTHRERRVTFSTLDVREEGNVKYYDTVAGGNQERINDEAVIECEAAVAEKDAAEDSGSENSLQRRSSEDNQRDDGDLDVEGHLQNMEFEPIPEPVELEKRKSLSSCSDSSLSDKEFNERKMIQENHSTPKASQLSEDSVQQRGDFSTAKNEEGPHISTESTIEIPGFSSEPFADWSPHTHYTNPSELWQENEEQFEFSDSVRSTSARSSSVSGSFNDSKRIVVPASNEQKRDDMSSSSSNVSEDEPTHYTVNSDKEEKKRERIHNKPEVNKACLKPDASFDEADLNRPSLNLNHGDNRFDKQWPTLRPQGSFSSHSSDSDGEDYTVKKGRVPSLCVTSHGKSLDTGAPLPPEAYSSSSSSESEAGTTNQQKQRVTHVTRPQIKESQTESHDSDTQQQWPALDLKLATSIKRRLDIKAPSPASDSSTSSDSEDEKAGHTGKQMPQKMGIAGPLYQESQTGTNLEDTRWPVLNLEHVPCIKRRLDIKAPSPPQGSSSQAGSHDPQTQWPALDLKQNTSIKRRLDIKAHSPASDSSSSSDSEDETTGHTERPVKVDITEPTFQDSQTQSHDRDNKWPALDLKQTMRIKRRLDIKAPSPTTGSSSSSDSEEDTTIHRKNQEKEHIIMATPPSKVSQTVSRVPQPLWPTLDLKQTTRIKRRLDIKAPSLASDSSSSSDGEDQTTINIKKQGQEHINMARPESKVSEPVSHDPKPQWPALDLKQTTSIKRRLDIKALYPASDSSSGSDSENETTVHTERLEKLDITGTKFQGSQTQSHDPDTKWPVVDLKPTMRIKRRLDIKAPAPTQVKMGLGVKVAEEDEREGELEYPRIRPLCMWPKLSISNRSSHKAKLRRFSGRPG
ncbi:Leucine-rich repeat-containing protein 66 [Dissostichus eleginoides]|uniref:Leucine-rich repeat-containing protein 66 n=1 Tax=Dissostichus eleginoides TaxID=100907 RepID=A0AAD9CBD1_DISEL|nr:Leucine-rich repeat-containing protein 66 [Dissostichus eleginoides]